MNPVFIAIILTRGQLGIETVVPGRCVVPTETVERINILFHCIIAFINKRTIKFIEKSQPNARQKGFGFWRK